MSLRFHEIAEKGQHLPNPLTAEDLTRLGKICDLQDGMRLLDLACGKGEILTQWAETYGVIGVGVDVNSTFVEMAKRRAFDLDMGNKVNFVTDDPTTYPEAHHQFDVVMSVGFGALQGNLKTRLNIMRQALKSENSLILIGEPFWKEQPTEAVCEALGITESDYSTLGGLLEQLESAGFDLHEMILADVNSVDRYESQQWMNVRQFLEEQPFDKDADALREWVATNRRMYLTYGRRYLGWGVFVLSEVNQAVTTPPRYENPDQPVGLDIVDEMLWVRLRDGRIIGNPLAWYPWLEAAPADALDDFTLTSVSIEWPELGERIEVSAMLRGHNR